MSGKKVTLVPTPMGNYVPIDQVRDDIASAYEKEVECEAQNMLLMYKNMCNGKVEAEVLVVMGDDVAETISGVVSACQIHKLLVGVSSQGNFMRMSKGTRTLSCSGAPTPGAIGPVTCAEPKNAQLSARRARRETRAARPPPVAKRESRDLFLFAIPKLVEFVSPISWAAGHIYPCTEQLRIKKNITHPISLYPST